MAIILFLLLKTQIPQSIFILDYEDFVIGYDGRTRNAAWVYERLCEESLRLKTLPRPRFSFSQDVSLPSFLRTESLDYRGSGYDRGHLCPFADLPDDSAGQSFFFSNISPQTPSFNRGIWARLEMQIRRLAESGKTLHVITLPMYLSCLDADGKRYVRYEVIGKSSIAVPTHFAKVIFVEGEEGGGAFAYLLPNGLIESHVMLDSFKTTPEEVQRLSGVLLPSPQ